MPILSSKVFRVVIALMLLVALVVVVDVHALVDALSHVTFFWLTLLLLLSWALIHVSAVKWGFFVEALGERVSVWRLSALYLVGYFVNLILPSYIGGDAVRSFYVGTKIGQHEAAAATILERYTGLVSMVVLGFVMMWFSEVAPLLVRVSIGLILLGLIVLTVIVLSPSLMSLLTRVPRMAGVLPHFQKIQSALRLAKQDRTLLVKAFALSFVFHTLTVVNTAVCGMAVGWEGIPWWGLFSVLPLILLVGALPLSPGGLGIQEGAFVFFLTAVGATPAQALGIGVILRAKSYLLALIGGVLWLGIKKEQGSHLREVAKDNKMSGPIS